MCKKTVINKACKPIINSSSDSNLFRQAVNRSADIKTEEEVAQEVAENGNKETIDVSFEHVEEAAPEDDPKPEQSPPGSQKEQPINQQPDLAPTGTDGPRSDPGF